MPLPTPLTPVHICISCRKKEIQPLQKLSQKLKDMSQKLTASIARIKGEALEGMVPEYIINKAEEHLLLIQGVRSDIDIALHELRSQMLSAEGKLATAEKVGRSLDNLILEAIDHKTTDE